MAWWGVVCFAVFLIGVTKSGFGSGVGLMITPLAALALGHTRLGSEAALGMLLPLLVAGDLIAIWQYRWILKRPVIVPCETPAPRPGIVPLIRLLPGTFVGVCLGFGLLRWLHGRGNLVGALIRIEIGCESLGLVSLHWWRLYRGAPQRLMREPARSHLTGAFAAASSTLAHAAGPIVAMYFLPLQLDRQLYVGVTAIYFFILNTAKLPAYAGAGLFAVVSPAYSLRFLPLVAVGAAVGLWLNRRMNDRFFMRVVYIATFVLGGYVLFEGVGMLRGG